MSKILRCKKCGDIIQSTHRHDMVWCKCGAVAIDGGDDYCKVSGNLEDMEFLSAEKDLNDMFVRCMQILEDKDKEIAILEKALQLAVTDKCKFENLAISQCLGIANGQVAVPQKEIWYKEQAEKELCDDKRNKREM